MRPPRRAFLTAAAVLVPLVFSPFTVTLPASAARCTSSVPYAAGTGGYLAYRIPAAVTTGKGTVLAFAEGRRGGSSDSGDIDVLVRRSLHGGCTWGPLTVVAAGKGNTRGNPAPVVDPRTGDVVLLTSYNSGAVTEAQIMRGEVTPEQSRRVFVQRSTDDGRTFSPPREITESVKRAGWRWYATGPGHAVALTRGPHAGRLVVPANHSVTPPAGSPDTGEEPRYYGAHALYSDNGGATWRLGFVDDSYDGYDNANESTAAELPDGTLYFSARDQHGTSVGHRLDSRSSDGGRTLDRPYTVQPTLSDVPIVHASVLQPDAPDTPLFFSGPSVPTARQAMAVWRSTDAGATFAKTLTLSGHPAAYSDLVQVGPDTLGVLYETGAQGTYERIEFRTVPLADLSRS
ncbi:exo-alpha-sialidase [Streptomyces sp. NPDC059861]|uniref:sialidase family protein n=1 Tax=Streptomyces sp. NPDC059861 TaxID=3346974 RepID=UPI0036665081